MNITMLMSAPYPPREGIGFYCTSLARELVRQQHRVTLITRGTSRTEIIESPEGYTVIKGRYLPVFPFHVHLHGKLISSVIKKLEAETDVFHLHSPLVPLIQTHKPIVTTVHTPMKPDIRSLELIGLTAYLAKLQAPISVMLENTLFKRTNVLTAVANSVAEELAEYGIHPNNVKVLGNGTDASYFTPESNTPQPGTVLYAGRLAHRKGLLDLLEAFAIAQAQRPDLHLNLAGSGPLEPELKESITQKRLQNSVSFLGHISSREDLRQIYRSNSIYVQPSHYEGLPTSLIEAMSCEKPVIATMVSGHLDLVRSGQNGLMVKPKQPNEIAHAILELIDDPDRAYKLGKSARQTILNFFTWQAISRNYLKLYQGIA